MAPADYSAASLAERRDGGIPGDPGREWQVVEYRGREGLVGLEAEWRHLYAAMRTRSVFHAYDANLAYVDHLMTCPDQLRCLVLLRRGQVGAICPLEARTVRVLGLPMKAWGGFSHAHWPFSDVLCPEDEARRVLLPALVRFLRARPEGRRLLILGPLPGASVLWLGLRRLPDAEYCEHITITPFVFACDQPYGELESRLSRQFRKQLRRCSRRLAVLEGAHFESSGGDADREALFEQFLAVEGSGWKGEQGTGSAIRLHDDYTAFYRALATDLGSGDSCEINALFAEGHCIAGEFCARSGEEYAVLKGGYDEAYARLSPGHLLAARTLQRCCDDSRTRRFEQLSDAAWMKTWRPDVTTWRQAHVAIGRWTSLLPVALLRLRHGPGRRTARWLRPKLESRRR